jgi:hypothetical protein
MIAFFDLVFILPKPCSQFFFLPLCFINVILLVGKVVGTVVPPLAF